MQVEEWAPCAASYLSNRSMTSLSGIRMKAKHVMERSSLTHTVKSYQISSVEIITAFAICAGRSRGAGILFVGIF